MLWQEAPGEPGGWGALLMRRYRLIMVLAAALPLWQQLSGINTVVFYSSEVKRRCPPGYWCIRRLKSKHAHQTSFCRACIRHHIATADL